MASWLISSGGKEGGVQHCSLCPLLVTVTFPLLSSDICGAHVLTCLALIGEVTAIGGLHLFSSVSPLCNVPGSGIDHCPTHPPTHHSLCFLPALKPQQAKGPGSACLKDCGRRNLSLLEQTQSPILPPTPVGP